MTLAFDIRELWAYEVLHNPVWKWAVLLVVLLGTFIVGKLVGFFFEKQGRRLEERKHLEMLRVLFSSASKPVQLVIFAIGLYVSQTPLKLDAIIVDGQVTGFAEVGAIRTFWIQVAKAIGALGGAWFIFRLVDVLEHFLSKWTSKTDTMLDDQLVPLVRKTLRVFIVIIASLFIAQNVFELDIGSLVAGLGIGGLAFALAAKDSIANLFGSVVIFADRPFSLGERVKIQGYEGTVEEVGFRSTKIRTLTGHLVTVPNNTVANEVVENVSRRPTIKRVLDVTVTYDTPPEKVQRGVEILREMLQARIENFPEDLPPRVFFNEFNAESLNIVVYYWFSPPDWWEYLHFNHDFNMELLRQFNEEGIEFAFPTQTLYLKPDGEFAASVRVSGPEGSRVEM